jgi:hypothetical protein
MVTYHNVGVARIVRKWPLQLDLPVGIYVSEQASQDAERISGVVERGVAVEEACRLITEAHSDVKEA